MPLVTPTHIPIARLRAAPIVHPWDDDDPEDKLGQIDNTVFERLTMVSGRARVAYALGCAEWVVARLSGQADAKLALNYIEAQWARMIDVHLGFMSEDYGPSDGPVDGPIAYALTQVTNCQYALNESGEGFLEASLADLVARHVLPEKTSFLTWQGEALRRLQSIYPVDKFPVTAQDVWGPPVPRDVLDPLVDLRLASPRMLCERFLRSLDFSANSYLVRPKVELGWWKEWVEAPAGGWMRVQAQT